MRHFLRWVLLTLPMLPALAPTGCGGGDGSNKVQVGDRVITLTVEPSTATKAVGQTQRYTAIATEEPNSVDVSHLVVWSSSDEDIATIDAKTGLATARSPGDVVITAEVSNVVATAEFIVTDVPDGSGGAAGATSEPPAGGAAGAAGESSTTGGAGGEGGAPDDTTPVTRLYVSNLGGEGIVPSIRIFEIGVDGDTAPVASLVGVATKLSGPSQMAVAENELFVANGEGRGILVFDANAIFDANATPDLAPIREISGTNTTFTPFSPMGLALRGDSIVASHQSTGLLVFPANGTGNLAPTALGPTFIYAAHVSNSPVGNEILVAVPSPSSEVRGYLETAGALDAPLRVLRPGRAWARGLTSTPTGVFVVTAGLVGASVEDSVTVFAHDAITDDAPIRAIAGDTTGLHDPHGISVHADEIFVANQSEHAVRVFDVDDDGDVAPLRIIKGPATELRFPAGVLVATTGG